MLRYVCGQFSQTMSKHARRDIPSLSALSILQIPSGWRFQFPCNPYAQGSYHHLHMNVSGVLSMDGSSERNQQDSMVVRIQPSSLSRLEKMSFGSKMRNWVV